MLVFIIAMVGKRGGSQTRRRRSRGLSTQLRAAYPLLCKLRALSPAARARVVSQANKSFYNVLGECCCLVLNGEIPLSRAQQTSLRRYKAAIRGIALKSKPLKYKRRVSQKGGFLSALLGAAVPLIGNLLGAITGRR